MTIRGYPSSAAFALYTAFCLLHMSLLWQTVHSHGFLRSDARLVTVEGRDMEHVAVCADPDRLHLTVSRQRSRMGRAARAEDLKRHIMQCITYHPHDNA